VNGTYIGDTPQTLTGVTGPTTLKTALTHSPGHYFKQWSTGETTAQITVTTGGTYTAIYDLQCTLIITSSTGGTTNPEPGTYYPWPGDTVSIQASESYGYSFDHFDLDGVNQGSTNPLAVHFDRINHVHVVHAAFVPKPYDVTIKAYCFVEHSFVSVSIDMDGHYAGNTEHTFTGLTGTHTFTVPYTDTVPYHYFQYWNDGSISVTKTISYPGGVYTAYYDASVGGVVVPVDKFALLTPYIGLASTAMIGAVATAVCVRRVKRREEKQ
jgi:hypothetical protein